MQRTKHTATVSAREAAQLLGIRLDAVYGLIWATRLAAVKRDGRWFVDRDAVDKRAKGRAARDATTIRGNGLFRPRSF